MIKLNRFQIAIILSDFFPATYRFENILEEINNFFYSKSDVKANITPAAYNYGAPPEAPRIIA